MINASDPLIFQMRAATTGAHGQPQGLPLLSAGFGTASSGCRGFTGPVPPPLWIRACSICGWKVWGASHRPWTTTFQGRLAASVPPLAEIVNVKTHKGVDRAIGHNFWRYARCVGHIELAMLGAPFRADCDRQATSTAYQVIVQDRRGRFGWQWVMVDLKSRSVPPRAQVVQVNVTVSHLAGEAVGRRREALGVQQAAVGLLVVRQLHVGVGVGQLAQAAQGVGQVVDNGAGTRPAPTN